MRREHIFKVTYLFFLLIVCLLSGSGCRSGMFGNRQVEWKRPDLSRMAFWRQENDDMPKPPALHFDPTPTEEKRIAQQSAVAKDGLAEKGEGVNLATNGDRLSGFKSSSSKALDELNHLADNMNDRPIRTPNQVSSESASLPGESRTTDANGDFLGDKARSDFLAAMNNVQPATTSSAVPVAASGAALASVPSSAGSTPSNPLFAQLPAESRQTPDLLEVNRSSTNQLSLDFPANSSNSSMGGVVPIANQSMARNLQLINAEAVPVTPAIGSVGGDRDFLPVSAVSANPVSAPQLGTNGSVAQVAQLDGNWPNSQSRSSVPPAGENFDNFLGSSSNSPQMGSQYPSTNRAGFSGQSNASSQTDHLNSVRSLPLQSDNRSFVQGSLTENSPSAPVANRVRNFANDVDIPDSVLQRQGSFAPGSLQPMRNLY